LHAQLADPAGRRGRRLVGRRARRRSPETGLEANLRQLLGQIPEQISGRLDTREAGQGARERREPGSLQHRSSRWSGAHTRLAKRAWAWRVKKEMARRQARW